MNSSFTQNPKGFFVRISSTLDHGVWAVSPWWEFFLRKAGPAFCAAVTLLVGAAAGGLLVQRFTEGAFPPNAAFRLLAMTVTAASSIGVGRALYQREGRLFLFRSFFFFVIGVVTLYACNMAASFVLPPWPAT